MPIVKTRGELPRQLQRPKGLDRMNVLRWRKMTWVLNVWNLLFLVWLIAGISNRASKDCAPGDNLCTSASDVGTGVGVALILVLWFLGFIVLSFVWLMTRRRGRVCPHCGDDVKKGRTACKNCGYDFVLWRNPQLTTAGTESAGGTP
jgi:hypothetical protein